MPEPGTLRAHVQRWRTPQGFDVPPAQAASAVELAHALLSNGENEDAAALLEAVHRVSPGSAESRFLLGCARRELQHMPEALDALSFALDLRPDDRRILRAYAETLHACGYPASAWFRRILDQDPGDLAGLRGYALALAAEGDPSTAQQVLQQALRASPGWLAGHRALATLRWTREASPEFAESYRDACAAQPANGELWLAWFSVLAQARRWDEALAVLTLAERNAGAGPATVLARLFAASESGDQARAEALFEATAGSADPLRAIAFIRHCLRTGAPERAATTAAWLIRTRAAPLAWPYQSLIWRLVGDERAAWLDGAPPYIGTFDLGLSVEDLTTLSGLLRGLHTAGAPYLDLSVRGGTQTDGQLFFRPEPAIRTVRARIEAAIRSYLARLPAPIPGHPLLAVTRSAPLRFAGSWSVLLKPGGHHVSHTHPAGWLSSALYVDVPSATDLGKPPAGWIAFGVAPFELGLTLPAYAEVEPRPGRLVLFPSTMWHCTHTFDHGERLVIAFDVRQPTHP